MNVTVNQTTNVDARFDVWETLGYRRFRVIPPTSLLSLPRDIWNDHLCYYVSCIDYSNLWQTMDRRIHVLIDSLTLDCLVLHDFFMYRSRLFRRMLARTKRSIRVDGIPKEAMRSFSSAATMINAKFRDIDTPLSFSHWPSMHTLRLTNVRHAPTSEYILDLSAVVTALPPTVTKLNVHDDVTFLWRKTVPHMFDLAGPKVIGLIFSRLPNLVDLDISSYALPLSSKSGYEWSHQYRWPPGLVRLVISVLPTKDMQLADIEFPSALTSLSILRSSLMNVRWSVVLRASRLPQSLVRFNGDTISLDYNTPLPSGIVELTCHAVSPAFHQAPFTMPSSLRWILPTIPPLVTADMPLNVRIMSRLGASAKLAFDDTTERDWTALELIMREDVDPDLVDFASQLAAKAFTDPMYWDDWRLGKAKVMDVILPRIVRTIRTASKVHCPSVVSSLLSSAKWLSTLEMTTVFASEAFLKFAASTAPIESATCRNGECRSRMPHLLSSVTMHLKRLDGDIFDCFTSLSSSSPGLALVGVHTLRVHLDIDQLVDPKFATAMSQLFPQLTSLEVAYSSVNSSPRTFPPSAQLKPLVDALVKLERLFIDEWGSEGINGFGQSSHSYFDDIPRRIRRVTIISGDGERIERTL